MSKTKDIIQVMSMPEWWVPDRISHTMKEYASIIFAACSLIMTIFNIINHSGMITYATMILVIGFIWSALASFIWKKEEISAGIITILVMFIFSYFAMSGANNGFAILWILLVPIFSISLLGIHQGIGLSIYFLIFLMILFYSPMREMVNGDYTSSFMARFPVLYLCDSVTSIVLALQKEYYYRIAKLKSYMDEMTGVFNRRHFMEVLQKEQENRTSDVTLMLIDVNGLKKVNDTLGHDAGDELICGVPDCCQKVLDKRSVVCRLGGDEFAVILFAGEQVGRVIMEELLECASTWHGSIVPNLSFSIGMVVSKKSEKMDVDLLYKQADRAMYEMKEAYYQTQKR